MAIFRVAAMLYAQYLLYGTGEAIPVLEGLLAAVSTFWNDWSSWNFAGGYLAYVLCLLTAWLSVNRVKSMAGSSWPKLIAIVFICDLILIAFCLLSITTLFTPKFWSQFIYRSVALGLAFFASNRYFSWRSAGEQ